jgi:hypothetical protein
LEAVGECPLDDHDIDVAVVSRAGEEMMPSERGALCAARHRIPVVVSGNPRHVISFGPGTHTAGGNLVDACVQAATSGVAHVAAVRRELLIAGVVTAAEIDGPHPIVSFEIRREPRRLRMVVNGPSDQGRLASIIRSAAEALRRFDPHASVIDVVSKGM